MAQPNNAHISDELLQSVENLQKQESERLVIDFDEAVEEQKAKSIAVKFDGGMYELPAEAPAWLPLFVNRHSDSTGELPDDKNMELIERLLGEGFTKKIVDGSNNFVSLEAVNDRILLPVMEQWGLEAEDTTEKKMD